MKMCFSIPKPVPQKPVPQSIPQSIPHKQPISINPFSNIFYRLQSSGSCKSCG